MSPLSTVPYRRHQWQDKATHQGDRERSQRTQLARISAERDRVTKALQEAQGRLRPLEAHRQGLVALPQGEVVWMARQLFLVARSGLRAVSRVLSLLALALGIHKAPCPQTLINGVRRLTRVRLDAARLRRGVPLSHAPFSHGLMWLIDSRMGVGPGTIWAVWAFAAPHPQLAPGALAVDRVRCIGVSVAAAWTGDTIAALLRHLSAVLGRPAASRKDGGGERHSAVALLDEPGLASPCLDDIAHAVAGMLKRFYQPHPTCETLVSAGGRVSGPLTHTMLTGVAPPTGRTQARFMHVHRFCTWAERVLKRSPAGSAKTGSTFAKWRACLAQ
jgi:hypothetical protein